MTKKTYTVERQKLPPKQESDWKYHCNLRCVTQVEALQEVDNLNSKGDGSVVYRLSP